MTEWIEVNKAKPTPFDLVQVAYENGQTQVAWWTGGAWDAGKDLVNSPIVAWRKVHEYMVRYSTA